MEDSATVKRQAQHIAKTSKDLIRLMENCEPIMRRYKRDNEVINEKHPRTNISLDMEEESRYFVDQY